MQGVSQAVGSLSIAAVVGLSVASFHGAESFHHVILVAAAALGLLHGGTDHVTKDPC